MLHRHLPPLVTWGALVSLTLGPIACHQNVTGNPNRSKPGYGSATSSDIERQPVAGEDSPDENENADVDVKDVTVQLSPLGGQEATGMVTFTPSSEGVLVSGVINNLRPGSRHGLHVHEVGDCSDPKGESAGEHYAPFGHPHGPPSRYSHAGDLGNIVADENGRAVFTVTIPGDFLSTRGPSFLGRSIVLHAQEDDFQTQPAGNSGARIACGVIPK